MYLQLTEYIDWNDGATQPSISQWSVYTQSHPNKKPYILNRIELVKERKIEKRKNKQHKYIYLLYYIIVNNIQILPDTRHSNRYFFICTKRLLHRNMEYPMVINANLQIHKTKLNNMYVAKLLRFYFLVSILYLTFAFDNRRLAQIHIYMV